MLTTMIAIWVVVTVILVALSIHRSIFVMLRKTRFSSQKGSVRHRTNMRKSLNDLNGSKSCSRLFRSHPVVWRC